MWCGVVWCSVVWCGVVWCGVVWCSQVKCTTRPPPRERIIVVVRNPCQENYPADAHPSALKSVLESANPAWTRSVHLDAPGQRHGQQPVSGTADPGVVKQDKSSRGSVDTTKTRSGPQRVRMSSGERPIGAAKGKQSDTEALCQTPLPSQRRSPTSVAGVGVPAGPAGRYGPPLRGVPLGGAPGCRAAAPATPAASWGKRGPNQGTPTATLTCGGAARHGPPNPNGWSSNNASRERPPKVPINRGWGPGAGIS